MFNKFFILKQHSDKYQYVFPDKYMIKNVIEEPFLFPCNDIQKYKHGIFVVVLTEISGDRNFLISSYFGNGDVCICFQSDQAWFELLYTAMSVVLRCHLYLPKKLSLLEKYLFSLTLLPTPKPGLVIYVPGCDPNDNAIKVVVPNKTRQRPFPVFISELRTRLEFEDWLIIFESLLLEKWIVFHSCHMDRVTSCLFAALSLLFPIEWVHLIFPCLSEASIDCLGCPSPYVAGMHSCLIERAIPLLGNGAVVVDIDQGNLSFLCPENESTNDDDRIPKNLVGGGVCLLCSLCVCVCVWQMNFLWRSWSSCDMKIIASRRRSPTSNGADEAVTSHLVHGFRHVLAYLLGRCLKCRTRDPTTGRYLVDKGALSLSRGETFQPFISRLLESQMVHQFLDDKINGQPRSESGFMNDIDDFEEACLVMERWQPDVYTDAIANMAVKSRRRMNVLANKVIDLAKKTDFVNSPNDGSDRRYCEMKDGDTNVELSCPALTRTSSEHTVTNAVPSCTRDWIQFDDCSPCLEVSRVRQTGPRVAETGNLLMFDDWGASGPSAGPSASVCTSLSYVPGIIRDFDPLFQS